MKKNTVVKLLGLSAIANPVVLSAIAHAIELTDYTNPVSRYEDAFVEGKLSTNSGNQDQTSYNGNLNLDWQSAYSSLPRTFGLRANALADVSRGPNDGDEQQKAVSANVAGNVDNYFKNDNTWFWYGSGEVGYLEDAENELVKVGAGVGYGRVINATPLAVTLRVVEKLREHGVLTRDLTKDQYLTVASIIERENEFKTQYGADEYKPYFFKAIEEELKSAGVLRDESMGAIGALFMDRVIYDEPISTRKHGWVARVGAGLVVQDYTGETDNDPSLDAVFEYAKPYGVRGQFQDILSYSTIFADNTDQLVSNNMSYTYELSDRVDWENRWTVDYLKSGDDEVNDILTNALATTFRYYLTNRVSAGATLSLAQVEDDIDDNGNDDTSVATFFDIRYRLK